MANSLMDAALNAGLDAISALLDQASLHDDFPGATGANEISGGSYARQSITWSAASGAAKDSSNQPAFSVPGGATVAWSGYWDTTGPTFMGYAPNRQAGDPGPTKYIVDVTNDTIEAPAHGFVNDDRVVFFGGTAPGGLTEGVAYWVVGATTDDFQVASTQGGAAINLTSQGDVDVRCSQIRLEAFASNGTFTLTDADIDFLT